MNVHAPKTPWSVFDWSATHVDGKKELLGMSLTRVEALFPDRCIKKARTHTDCSASLLPYLSSPYRIPSGTCGEKEKD
jgi:hypothetical protein